MATKRKHWINYNKTINNEWSTHSMYDSVVRYLKALGYYEQEVIDFRHVEFQRGETAIKALKAVDNAMEWTCKVTVVVYKVHLEEMQVCDADWEIFSPVQCPAPPEEYWFAEMQGLDDVAHSDDDAVLAKALANIKSVADDIEWG